MVHKWCARSPLWPIMLRALRMASLRNLTVAAVGVIVFLWVVLQGSGGGDGATRRHAPHQARARHHGAKWPAYDSGASQKGMKLGVVRAGQSVDEDLLDISLRDLDGDANEDEQTQQPIVRHKEFEVDKEEAEPDIPDDAEEKPRKQPKDEFNDEDEPLHLQPDIMDGIRQLKGNRPAAVVERKAQQSDAVKQTWSGILFVDVYSEQSGRSINNFARLLTLSKILGRQIPEPFMHNSRMAGMVRKDIGSIQNFSYFFDVDNLNGVLRQRGYRPLLPYSELVKTCRHGWDTVVILQVDGGGFNRPELGLARNLKEQVDSCRQRAGKSADRYADCPVLARLARLLPEQRRFQKRLRRFRQAPHTPRGVIVNAGNNYSIRNLVSLLTDSKCVALLEWAGEGERRVNFRGLDALKSYEPVRPYEITHSDFIKSKAKEFVREHLGKTFLAVHLRLEKAAKSSKRIDGMKECITNISELAKRLLKAMDAPNGKIFLATDLGEHGSDTFEKFMKLPDRLTVQGYAEETLPNSVTPSDFGLTDRGARAMVEMEIAALAKDLIVVGGGNFQEWMIDLFQLNSGREPYRRCFYTKVPPGWQLHSHKPT